MGICDRYVLKKLVCLGSMLWDKTISGPCSEVGPAREWLKRGMECMLKISEH